MMEETEMQTLAHRITAAREGDIEPAIPILEELAFTPYACSSVEQVSGGVVNFTFRGFLSNPLPDGSSSVIIKHSKDFSGFIPGVQLQAARCQGEQRILQALANGLSPIVHHNGIRVQTPCHYHFIPHLNAQVMEEFPDVTALGKFLLSPESNKLPVLFVASIGRALGRWLTSFHDRSSGPGVVQNVGCNEKGRDAMYTLLAGGVAKAMDSFPSLFDGRADDFQEYVEESIYGQIDGASKTIVHGDFAVRNILISNSAATTKQDILVSPIDWEVYHLGCIEFDLGQFLGDLYTHEYFKGVGSCTALLQGFVDGYKPLNKKQLSSVAVYTGIQILAWAPVVAAPMTREEEEQLVSYGRDLIFKGKEEDWGWLESSYIGPIFKKGGEKTRVARHL